MAWQDEQDIENIRKYEKSFWQSITISGDDDNECWNWWKTIRGGGYGGVGIRKKATGKSTTVQAHRYSWIIHNGSIPEGMFCLHICDNSRCVNPDHLYLGNQSDNMQDKHRRGRMNGYKHSEDVKRRISETEKKTKLAKKLGLK